MFKKAYVEIKIPFVALLEYRNTFKSGKRLSPAQMLFSRSLRTTLPISNRLLNPEIFQNTGSSRKQRKSKQKFYYDKL